MSYSGHPLVAVFPLSMAVVVVVPLGTVVPPPCSPPSPGHDRPRRDPGQGITTGNERAAIVELDLVGTIVSVA